MNTEWRGGYNLDVKQRLRTFLQRNYITYTSFLKYCKYSRKDFRKFMIIENEIGICRKSYKLNKKSLHFIMKKKHPKYIKKNQIKRSYPIVLYHLGTCFKYFKKNRKEMMFKLLERSGKLGFKKSIVELYRKTISVDMFDRSNFKLDEEKFYKSLKFICE